MFNVFTHERIQEVPFARKSEVIDSEKRQEFFKRNAVTISSGRLHKCPQEFSEAFLNFVLTILPQRSAGPLGF